MREYSRKQTDKAGDVLSGGNGSAEQVEHALNVLDSWRSLHVYPMHVFERRLRRVAEEIDPKALSAQRLKRVPSIVKKLKRVYSGNKPSIKLSQMQDIVGCRAVLPNIKLAKKLYEEKYLQGKIKHELVRKRNYVLEPKVDGYRSYHLVYKYRSDKNEKYNNLLVEVQIRSKLQHIWATAVETVGLFIGQAIKSNEGEDDWNIFFRLVSSAFAKIEGCPIVSGTPQDEKELYSLIRNSEKKLSVISKMEKWNNSLRFFDDFKERKGLEYFLLEIDTIQDKLTVTAFTEKEKDVALKLYSDAEKRIYGNSKYDVVLVGVDKISDLKKAYPNYFVDTKEFIEFLKIIINKYDI